MAKVIEKRSATKPPPLVSKAELAEQAGVTRRKTRKPKEQPEPEVLPEIDPVVVKTTVSVPFDVIARVRGVDSWSLTDDEANKLTAAWVPVFNLWLMPHMGQYTILAAALISTIGLVTSKAVIERDQRKEELKKKDAAKSDNSHIRT